MCNIYGGHDLPAGILPTIEATVQFPSTAEHMNRHTYYTTQR